MLRRRPDRAEASAARRVRDRRSVHGLRRGPAAHDRAGGDRDRVADLSRRRGPVSTSSRVAGAQFMSRFLAPQVAELVRARGLKSATEEKTLEVSVVCCDLRGFTAFTAATSSTQGHRDPARVLRRRGRRRGGVWRHHQGPGRRRRADAGRRAGLVRGPRAQGARDGEAHSRQRSRDHVALVGRGPAARGRRRRRQRLTSRSASSARPRGSNTPRSVLAVNLAARLCSEAAHGQVLVDARTTALCSAAARRRAASCNRARRCS